jgi:hypothetical protein
VVVVVVGAVVEGGGFGLVVVVGCFGRIGVVFLTVPTGATEGVVVVDTFEVMEVVAACWVPQAARTTERDATKTRVTDKR